MKDSHSLFYVVGFITVLFMAAIVLFVLFSTIKNWIDDAIFRYKYKHRFNKSPTAKCYCKDCTYHGNEEHPTMCRLLTRYTPLDGFCYKAEPIMYKEAKKMIKEGTRK